MTNYELGLYARALETWGVELQSMMLSEEVGELMQAWSKYRRGLGSVVGVIEEIADVQIMLDQIMLIMARECELNVDFLTSRLKQTKKSKLERLKNIIETSEQRG